jgi:heme o synthase
MAIPAGGQLIAADTSRSRAATLDSDPQERRWPVRLGSRIGVYIELTKPGIVRMVLITAGTGFFLAAGPGLDVLLLLHTLVGMGLAASGSCGLNEYVERDADARMARTAGRPIPSGRMLPRNALYFSAALAVLGVVHLVAFVSLATAALVALTVLSYVLVYTPLKRRTWLSTLVGAVPGALPILAGWVAGGGGLTGAGLALFGILFLWQMPHFYALAWIYRADYARGGFRMITALDVTGARTGGQIVFFGVALLVVSMLPAALGLSGRLYLVAALVLGGAFLLQGIAMARHRDDRHATRLFLGSVAYLPLLLITMAIDRLVG